MDEFESSASDSDYANSWVSWFLGCKGNEYFCELDEEYITDRFNLTYINNEVQHYNDALELITDTFGTTPSIYCSNSIDQNVDSKTRDVVEKAGGHLYGLLHARYILTPRGLQKMVLILIALLMNVERKVPQRTFWTVSSCTLQRTSVVAGGFIRWRSCIPGQIVLCPL
jgi:hypothetical protein